MRLIDIDDISLRKTIACGGLSAKALWRRIQQQPTIDAVSVVRCKECRYKDMELCAMHKLVVAGVRKYDDFCSYGERSDNGKDIQSATE